MVKASRFHAGGMGSISSGEIKNWAHVLSGTTRKNKPFLIIVKNNT